jgi:hypothetical protein
MYYIVLYCVSISYSNPVFRMDTPDTSVTSTNSWQKWEWWEWQNPTFVTILSQFSQVGVCVCDMHINQILFSFSCTSFSGSSNFKTLPGKKLSWLRIFIVFPQPTHTDASVVFLIRSCVVYFSSFEMYYSLIILSLDAGYSIINQTTGE